MLLHLICSFLLHFAFHCRVLQQPDQTADDLLDRSIWHDLRSLADYDPFTMFESKGMPCMGKLELVASLKKNNTTESEVEETR